MELDHRGGVVGHVAVRERSLASESDAKRYGFDGAYASDEVAVLYVGKRVPDRYRKKGVANPIQYTWLDRDKRIYSSKHSTDPVTNRQPQILFWVSQWGPKAEILEPPELRERAREWFAGAAMRYEQCTCHPLNALPWQRGAQQVKARDKK